MGLRVSMCLCVRGPNGLWERLGVVTGVGMEGAQLARGLCAEVAGSCLLFLEHLDVSILG